MSEQNLNPEEETKVKTNAGANTVGGLAPGETGVLENDPIVHNNDAARVPDNVTDAPAKDTAKDSNDPNEKKDEKKVSQEATKN